MHPAPELLAPAGNWDCVRAAIANGADAVYFGLPRFNARIRADNFTEEQLPEVVALCHRHGVLAYVAFNTLVFTGELDAAAGALRTLSRSGVDALIVQDVGAIRLARRIVPDLPIHASTQMTLTSPEGVDFARTLGVERVVLGREVSLREMAQFQPGSPGAMPLEVFVHGALCVAYSGQCLTSESLGQRSANRGECAQACRMPYELIVDGEARPLGDKRYLLSPQDLAAVDHIPELIALGIQSFKIEGRLKDPEYVAAVCQVYRKAIDRTLEGRPAPASAADRYQLEMTFSRGLFPGWMQGVNHQSLVLARFGKKRGPLAGRVVRVGTDHVEIDSQIHLAPGDGIVFDTGGDTNAEQGGRIFEVRGSRLYFQHGHIDFRRLKNGDRLWKTHDPALEKQLRRSFAGALPLKKRIGLHLRVEGCAGQPLRVRARTAPPGAPPAQVTVEAASRECLVEARTAPLNEERLREHLGRFDQAPFFLQTLEIGLEGAVLLPIAAINRLRRALINSLLKALPAPGEANRRENPLPWRAVLQEMLSELPLGAPEPASDESHALPRLSVLCRDSAHIEAALKCGVTEILLDFEDVRRYRAAVDEIRNAVTQGAASNSPGAVSIWLATPRIQKAGEQGFFRLLENSEPDGVLVRNLGAIDFFKGSSNRRALRLRGDFSLNISNPLSAAEFLRTGMESLTLSYDLTADQVIELMESLPHAIRNRMELTLHQHMPMFHMEHCVFAAFLSKGSSYLDCGRPCEKHRVHLRDRTGVEHPLRADVGCRNTLFNAAAQTGAHFYERLYAAGLRRFRVELLEESREQSERILRAYQGLITRERNGADLWKHLRAKSQLGVTAGTLATKSNLELGAPPAWSAR